MSIFIKPGFWEEKKLAPKHWLNLNQLITNIVNSLLPPTPTYKVYTALLYQSGTNNPTATVLQNTFGVDFVWTRLTHGIFTVTAPSGTFTENKTVITMSLPSTTGNGIFLLYDDEGVYNNVMRIEQTTQFGSPSKFDGMQNVYVEIKVFN